MFNNKWSRTLNISDSRHTKRTSHDEKKKRKVLTEKISEYESVRFFSKAKHVQTTSVSTGFSLSLTATCLRLLWVRRDEIKTRPVSPAPPPVLTCSGCGLGRTRLSFFSAVRQTSSRLALSGTLCFLFFFGRGSKVKEQIWTTAGACLSPAGSSWEEAILKRQSREEGAGLAASPFPTLAF